MVTFYLKELKKKERQNIWRIAEIDFHEARSDAFGTLDKIDHIWGKNVHKPQMLMVLKEAALP